MDLNPYLKPQNCKSHVNCESQIILAHINLQSPNFATLLKLNMSIILNIQYQILKSL